MTEASDLLQKLSLDSPPKTDNAVEVAKEVIFIFLADIYLCIFRSSHC